MGFQYAEFSSLTGLTYDRKNKTLSGTMSGGFPVFVRLVPRRDAMMFRLIAKLPDHQTPETVSAALEQWRMAHLGISGLIYRERALTAGISCAGTDTERKAASVIAELVALAADLGMIPCCMSCGKTQDFSLYLLDGTGVTVCDGCKTHLEEKMQEDQAQHAAQKPHTAGLLTGALTGALFVFLLTLFTDVSILTVLTGYAGLTLGFLAMKKLGKKLTRKAVIVCAVLCMLAGCCGSVLHLSRLIAANNRDNVPAAQEIQRIAQNLLDNQSNADTAGSEDLAQIQNSLYIADLTLRNQSTAACLRSFPQFVKTDVQQNLFGGELSRSLAEALLWIAVSVTAGTLLTAPKLLRADSGEHQLVPLQSA